MVRPLEGLAIGLQAIAQLSQQIGHHIMADAMTEPVKPGRQMAQALRRPQQWRHRIAARRRLDQFLEIGKQRQVRGDQPPAPTACAANAIRRRRGHPVAA